MRSHSATWAAYAACAWALIFAVQSFYWAAGGTVGLRTQAASIKELARDRDPSFITLVWATAGLKVMLGLLALALVQRWGRIVRRWMLLAAAWAAGAGMALYGGLGLLLDSLRATNVLRDAGDRTAVLWHVFLWDPWWLLGGALFIVAARRYSRTPRPPAPSGHRASRADR